MIINSTALTGLFSGFSTSFNKGFAGAESQYQQIAMVAPSQSRDTTYAWLGQLPRLREWLGERRVKSIAAHGYKITNRNFESTVEVPANDIKDDQYGVYGPMIEDLGRAAAEHPDEMIFELLASGFTSPGYDGQNFFDTDHVGYSAAGQEIAVSNFGAGDGAPWYLLDTSRAIRPLIYQERESYKLVGMTNPDAPNVFLQDKYLYGVQGRSNAGFGLWQLAYASKAPLTVESYAAARAAMSAVRGDEGRLLGIRPDTLVVPTSMEAAGRTVINAALTGAGASNIWAGTAKLIVSPWLAG